MRVGIGPISRTGRDYHAPHIDHLILTLLYEYTNLEIVFSWSGGIIVDNLNLYHSLDLIRIHRHSYFNCLGR